jgi:putative ubiquitin-RnfH superfamily antitoxin RatB of RatAB toxin-antitoxin module
MTESNKIPVEVAYALPHKQEIVMLEVSPGITAAEVVARSGIEKKFPGLETAGAPLGIFGKAIKPDHEMRAGERIEIYRPLIADPKEVRKERAAKAKEARAAAKSAAKDTPES